MLLLKVADTSPSNEHRESTMDAAAVKATRRRGPRCGRGDPGCADPTSLIDTEMTPHLAERGDALVRLQTEA